MAGYNCGGADDAAIIKSNSSGLTPDFSSAFFAASNPRSIASSSPETRRLSLIPVRV